MHFERGNSQLKRSWPKRGATWQRFVRYIWLKSAQTKSGGVFSFPSYLRYGGPDTSQDGAASDSPGGDGCTLAMQCEALNGLSPFRDLPENGQQFLYRGSIRRIVVVIGQPRDAVGGHNEITAEG
jgi:hypothetical protein